MRIYSLRCDTDHFHSLTWDGSYRQFYFFGKKQGSKWKQKSLKLYPMKEKGDFLGFTHPAITTRGWAQLRPLIKDHVEPLPVRCGKEELFLLNVTTVLKALDEESSDIDRDDDGTIFYVGKYVFLEEAVRKAPPIFLIRGLESSGGIFVTEAFADSVDEHGLTGLALSLRWESKRTRKGARDSKKKRELLKPAELLVSLASKITEYRQSSGALTDTYARPARLAYYAWLLDSEIGNGGYTQFFYNHGLKEARSVRAALKDVGAEHALEVFELAVERFKKDKRQARALRSDGPFQFTSPLTKDLDRLSKRHYPRARKKHLDLLLLDYVEGHRKTIEAALAK